MKLKTKIASALGLMTALILMLAVASGYFLNELGSASENITKDNFLSIECANVMIDGLDAMDNTLTRTLIAGDAARLSSERTIRMNDSLFQNKLAVAASNVTEPGEKEIITLMQKRYKDYHASMFSGRVTKEFLLQSVAVQYDSLKASCIALLDVNKKGVIIRNNRAKGVTSQAVLYTIVFAASAFLLAIIALFSFPGLVTKPIIMLTSKIRSIANKKYSERVEIKSHDEIGELALSFNQMASRLDEYERSNIDELIAEKKRSEAIVKSMNDGVLVLSPDFTILVVNSVAVELLGLEESELVGKDARDVARQNNLVAKIVSDIISPDKENENEDAYLRIYHDSKEEFYIRDTIRIERTEGDPTTALGYVIELKNVSEFKALDEAKSGFVTTVSHELRTPLSALNMSLRLLQDERIGQMNPEQKRLLDAMKQEIKRLLRIVGELLELSRAEVGTELMHIAPVPVENIVDAAVTPMMLQADQKHVALDIELPPDIPLVQADSSKIAWVLINLLSNAIRFTPSGGKVQFNVSARDNRVDFSVSDTGIGIEPQNLERIFDKFFQVKGKSTDHHSGVGLGLAISKEIIEAHGGRLWAESEVGKGSKFVFSLIT